MAETRSSSSPHAAGSRRWQFFPRWIGLFLAVFGLLIIASWHGRWSIILQTLPGTAPMQYNTAVCFVLFGAALTLLTTERRGATVLLGGAAGLFGLVTLLEYVTGRNLGVDLLFFIPYFEEATAFPGRMSPLTAVCFIFFGGGFLLAGINRGWHHRLTAVGLLGCMVGVIGCVALLGYGLGIGSAYGWGAYSRMAVNTAGLLLLGGLGLLVWAWQAGRRENLDFLRWLPVSAALTLMIMIALVSAVSFAELRHSADWRQHSHEVMTSAGNLLDSLDDAQSGIRGYLLTAQPAELEPYEIGVKQIPQELERLLKLTRDNPEQQRRLKTLANDVDRVLAYSHRLLDEMEENGLQSAIHLESTGEGLKVMDRAETDLKVFTEAEDRLLKERSQRVEAEFQNTARLLVFGSIVAAGLLVLANYLANREVNRRRLAEARSLKLVGELQQSLAEVKTLSGLIPICGWCKNVRSDTGYWQSVEQYVRAHTDATFSHGLCPSCGEKMRADILKANSGTPEKAATDEARNSKSAAGE